MISAPLIGIGGKPASGKDTFADHLIHEHGWKRVNMSAPIDLMMRDLDPIVDARITVTGPLRRFGIGRRRVEFIRYTEHSDSVGFTAAKTHPEFRRLLQEMGFKVGRQRIDERIWVNLAARSIDEHLTAGHSVVLSGVRTPEEVSLIADRGGVNLWVDRPGNDAVGAGHAIENSISADAFDHVVRNDGTIDDLHRQARDWATRVGGTVRS